MLIMMEKMKHIYNVHVHVHVKKTLPHSLTPVTWFYSLSFDHLHH